MGFVDFRVQTHTNSQDITRNLRTKILARGLRGMLSLYRMFKVLDIDEAGLLPKDEFSKVLRDFKIEVSETDMLKLIRELNIESNMQINYYEFINQIRGLLNKKRKDAIDKIFNQLDEKRQGYILMDEIKSKI